MMFFHNMDVYAVYVNPEEENSCILAKSGFSFLAAIFNVLWAVYNKSWTALLIAIALNVILVALNPFLNFEALFAIKAFVFLLFGFFANDFLEYDLQRKGYIISDIIIANSALEAEMKFFSKNSEGCNSNV